MTEKTQMPVEAVTAAVATEIEAFTKAATAAEKAANSANQAGAYLVGRLMQAGDMKAAEAEAAFIAICKDQDIPARYRREPLALLPQAVAMLAAGVKSCPAPSRWESAAYVEGVAAMAATTLKMLADENGWEAANEAAVEAVTAELVAANAEAGRRKAPTKAEISAAIRRNRPSNASGTSGGGKSPAEIIAALVESAKNADRKAAVQIRDLLEKAVEAIDSHHVELDGLAFQINESPAAY